VTAAAPAISPGAIELGGAAFFADPYPTYARIVAGEAPVFDSLTDSWLVGGYKQVEALLRDTRMSKQFQRAVPTPFETSVLFRDPPDHSRARAVLNRAFSSGVMDGLEQRILAIADGLIDRMLEGRTADFLTAFAVPLPVAAIAELLGIPNDNREQIHLWSSQLIVEEGVAQAESDRRQYAAICAMDDYFRRLLTAGDPTVASGLIGALTRPTPSGDRVTNDELIGNCILLLVAGHETTVNLLGNGLLLLLQRPALLAQLRVDPARLPAFLEEVLRFESPVQTGTFRVTTEPVEIGGASIAAGQKVTALIGAANRDPAIFPDPNRFDPTRAANPHLAFGLGPHRCVGAMLARMEARIAFTRLLERLPNLQLAVPAPEPQNWLHAVKRRLGLTSSVAPAPPPPAWRHNAITRGLRRLDVAF
jgi:cytochrome P450